MNFDFSWFTTIQGLFITGGVILLIVALVILLVSNKKTKDETKKLKEKKSEENAASLPVMTNPDISAMPMPVNNGFEQANPVMMQGNASNVGGISMEQVGVSSTPEVVSP